MTDIEPYEYQRKTNLKEHNDLVAKINEIVDVINNTDLENIGPRIDAIESTDTLQWTDIESLKTKATDHDNHLATNDEQIKGITESLVTDVAIMNGTTTGSIKVRIERENAPSIDSDDYNIQKPTSVELVQGSAPAMVKAQITLSDGTVLVSDDFMFTTESIGQDVYISSFVFKNGNVAGTISADIGLSNGTTLEANNFVVPTDPNVLTTIGDLTTRIEALEQIDIGALKTTVDGHTASIEALDNDVADLQINKADVNNVNQVIVSKQIDLQSIVRVTGQNEDSTEFVKYGIVGGSPTYPFTVTQETGAFGQKIDKPIATIALLNSDGSPKNFTSGGEVWEEIDLSNFPTDWADGDRIKVIPKCYPTGNASAWNIAPSATLNTGLNSGECIEFMIKLSEALTLHSSPFYINYGLYRICFCLLELNTGNFNSSNTEYVMFTIRAISFNGGGTTESAVGISKSNLSNYFLKMWRLKK